MSRARGDAGGEIGLHPDWLRARAVRRDPAGAAVAPAAQRAAALDPSGELKGNIDKPPPTITGAGQRSGGPG